MSHSESEQLRTLGNWIRVLRTMRGLTQEDLAQQAGIDPGLLGIIERGERNWGVAHIWPIADALQVPVSDLFLPPEDSVPPRPRGTGPRMRRTRDDSRE